MSAFPQSKDHVGGGVKYGLNLVEKDESSSEESSEEVEAPPPPRRDNNNDDADKYTAPFWSPKEPTGVLELHSLTRS